MTEAQALWPASAVFSGAITEACLQIEQPGPQTLCRYEIPTLQAVTLLTVPQHQNTKLGIFKMYLNNKQKQ